MESRVQLKPTELFTLIKDKLKKLNKVDEADMFKAQICMML